MSTREKMDNRTNAALKLLPVPLPVLAADATAAEHQPEPKCKR